MKTHTTEEVLEIVKRTLEYVAKCDMSRNALYDFAEIIPHTGEKLNAHPCCFFCDEVECYGDCPFETVRNQP